MKRVIREVLPTAQAVSLKFIDCLSWSFRRGFRNSYRSVRPRTPAYDQSVILFSSDGKRDFNSLEFLQRVRIRPYPGGGGHNVGVERGRFRGRDAVQRESKDSPHEKVARIRASCNDKNKSHKDIHPFGKREVDNFWIWGNRGVSLSTALELIRSGHRIQSLLTSELQLSYRSSSTSARPIHSFVFRLQEVAMALTYFFGLSTAALVVVGLCTLDNPDREPDNS